MTGVQARHEGVRGGHDGFIDLNNRHDGGVCAVLYLGKGEKIKAA